MERVASDEERIRRAEEIYYRRKAQGVRVASSSVNVGKTRKVSLGRKMIIQILACLVIYIVMQIFHGYNNIFSDNVINQVKAMLSYDVNFQELYNQFVEYFNGNFNIIDTIKHVSHGKNNEKIDSKENGKDTENVNEISQESANNQEEAAQEGAAQEGAAQEGANSQEKEEPNTQHEANTQEDTNNGNGDNQSGNVENGENVTSKNSEGTEATDISSNMGNDGTLKAKQDAENKTQMEQDAEYIKHNCNIIQPIQGIVTSRFGDREETEIISAFHQGVDIAANTGTPIYAAMEGTVVAASYAGEYGNHIKIQNGEVLTVYAHCSELEVNVGDYINQKQEIGKVGATGKVTGPHLHFEIRRDGRYVNPELILSF